MTQFMVASLSIGIQDVHTVAEVERRSEELRSIPKPRAVLEVQRSIHLRQRGRELVVGCIGLALLYILLEDLVIACPGCNIEKFPRL